MGEDGPTRSPDWTVTPPLLLTLACATPGTGQITLVDFVDAEGHLEEDWSAKTATWTTTTDALELWVLDAPTGCGPAAHGSKVERPLTLAQAPKQPQGGRPPAAGKQCGRGA